MKSLNTKDTRFPVKGHSWVETPKYRIMFLVHFFEEVGID